MNKSSLLLELLIKKPCKECLVKPCCKTMCISLYKWRVKHRLLIKLNCIIISILGCIGMTGLIAFELVGIMSKDSANFYANIIRNVVEENSI